jgi:hypothetical protein
MYFINKLIQKQIRKRVLITICAPDWDVVYRWGDYHLAMMLKRQFESNGFSVHIDLYNSTSIFKEVWYLSIHLRGLHKLMINFTCKNKIIWLISHPDNVNFNELNSYDHIFIASKYYIEKNRINFKKPYYYVPQFSDPKLFYYEIDKKLAIDVLFVGNTRGIFRQSVKYLINSKYNFQIWGEGWKEFIEEKYIYGKNISYNLLHKYYSSAKVVLNDHWNDMKKMGFINNRFYDVSLSQGLCVNDNVYGLSPIDNKYIVKYKSFSELDLILKRCINDNDFRKKLILNNYKHYLKNNSIQFIYGHIFNNINI